MIDLDEPDVWDSTWINDDHEMHLTPPGDLVGHELDGSCVCGPYREDIGEGDVVYVHSALDGRP